MAKKTKNTVLRIALACMLCIGGLLGYFLWSEIRSYLEARFPQWEDRENTFSSYSGFGIWIPDGFAIHGIDVSKYQKRINWHMVGKMKDKGLQLRFAFIKATEGADMVDQQFRRNWRKSRESGLVRGAYHFFRSSSSGHEQAMAFIREVKLLPGDLPPVLDVEAMDGANSNEFLDEVEVWLRVVEEHYKVKPVIYTYASFYNNYLAARCGDYPLWVAHYENRQSPGVRRLWHFWQHNEAGRVNGIKGRVDFNVFNGTDEEFKQLLIP